MDSDLGNKEVMAQNIQYYMNKKGITRKKLSADLGISYTTLASWLQADSYPRIDKIELMANYFNISKSDLVESRDKKSNVQEEHDLDKMLDEAKSFDGKPMTPHDREIIKGILRGYYENK